MRLLKFTELSEVDLKDLGSARSINIVMGVWNEAELDLFFGPIPEAEITLEIPDDMMWDKALVACGFFKSRKDAKNTGWGFHIPRGFSMHRIGKFHREIAALNTQVVADENTVI